VETQPKRDYNYEGWLALRTPLLHGDGEALGNVRLFRAQKMVCSDGAVRRIPVYSGNAFRGILRDIAARQLMQALGVALPPGAFHFLTSGGSLTSGGGNQTVDVDFARNLRNTVPMVGVFGGGVGSQILEGKLYVLNMTPICRETTHLLPDYCKAAPSATLSVRDLRHLEFGTRRDDSKSERAREYLQGADPLDEGKEKDGVPTAMIYENETLAPGSCLRFGFRLKGSTQKEWTCLAMALLGWMSEPFLGGRSAAGYGEVAAPVLYPAVRKLSFRGESSDVSLASEALARIDSEVDTQSRLELLAEGILGEYSLDVEGRRSEILDALARVV
jgi:hypothetical protein